MSGIKKSERGQASFKNVKVPYMPTPKIEGNIASRQTIHVLAQT
jgi:hypothetical protein